MCPMLRARVKTLEVIVTMPAIFEWLALSQSVHWWVSDLEPLDLIFLRCPSWLAEIPGLSENGFQVIKSEQPSPGVPSNFRILSTRA
jgi:hypothetical protein